MRRLHVVFALILASLLQGCSSSSSQSNPKTLQSVVVTRRNRPSRWESSSNSKRPGCTATAPPRLDQHGGVDLLSDGGGYDQPGWARHHKGDRHV
jgi:hypothetical protein